MTIQSWNFRAEGKVWCEQEAISRFFDQLRHCYETVSGVAAFRSTEGNLTFQETFAEGNELRFRIQTDQSFVGAALPENVA